MHKHPGPLVLFSFFLCFASFSQAQSPENVYPKRDSLMRQGWNYQIDDDYVNSIRCYRDALELDADTMLLRAQLYGRIANVYARELDDTAQANEAERQQLYYIKESIRRYPDNMMAYIFQLNVYRYAGPEAEKAPFVALAEQRFAQRWEMMATLADYYSGNECAPVRCHQDLYLSYIHKTLALKPDDFNSLLLLLNEIPINSKDRKEPLKKLYALHPEQFYEYGDVMEINEEGKMISRKVYTILFLEPNYYSLLYVEISEKERKMLKLK